MTAFEKQVIIRLESLENKVDALAGWRNQVIGASAVVGAVVSWLVAGSINLVRK